jgi:DNA polymerase III delta subunit
MNDAHIVLYGTSDELIQIRLMGLVNEALTRGAEVAYLDGKNATKADVSDVIDVGLFGSEDKLAVITRVGSLPDSEKVLGQTEVPCIIISGRTIPKMLMKVRRRESFEEPKSYQKEDWCVGLLRDMVQQHGKSISEPIARSVVRRVGLDLGVLRWESLKFKYASDSEALSPSEVVSVLAPLSELDGVHLVDAVFKNDPKHFLKVCDRFESIRKGDPTIAVSTGLLHSSILSSLEIQLLMKSGVTSSQEIGSRLGKSPWLLDKVLIPKSRVFSVKKLRSFLGVLYRCETLALNGSVSAWVALKSGIVRVMIS